MCITKATYYKGFPDIAEAAAGRKRKAESQAWKRDKTLNEGEEIVQISSCLFGLLANLLLPT